MNAFLKISTPRGKRTNTSLIMNQAGCHKSRTLKLPNGITVMLWPPYSPELNPVEDLWHYLRSRYLSNGGGYRGVPQDHAEGDPIGMRVQLPRARGAILIRIS